MTHLIAAVFATVTVVLPLAVQAQDAFSVDIGGGVAVEPTYPGADDVEARPWLTWRNVGGSGDASVEGFSISPSFGAVGAREPGDDPALAGLGKIDRAYELGAKASYTRGPVTGYVALRKGFGGHDGLAGEAGVTYRTDASDRLSLSSGLELGYGDDSFNQTYFGISAADAAGSGRTPYDPGGGINRISAKLEARYSLTENTAILGEVEYGRLVGDAGDSPLVQDRSQPAVRLGIVRNFSFGF